MLIVGVVMMILTISLGIVMTVVAVKVKRLTWQTDKIIPLMLILMCCTLYSSATYFFFDDILDYAYFPKQTCMEHSPLWFAIIDGSLSVMPSFFLGVGCMLNLNKWIYFYLRIVAFVNVGQGLSMEANDAIETP